MSQRISHHGSSPPVGSWYKALMRVCVDIQAAVSQGAGVGRYTRCLVQHLGPLRDHDELELFCFDFKRNGIGFDAPEAAVHSVRWIPGRIVQRAWRSFAWPPFDWFAGPADVYHFTNFIRPPLARGRSMVTIYDASFLRFPEAAEPGNLAYLTGRIRQTAERADAIQTISEFSAREIEDLLQVPPERIHVAYPGLDHHRPVNHAMDSEIVENMYGLDRPYLLFVGTLEPRKNLPFLVEVFDALSDFDGILAIAGMKGWKVEPVLESLKRARRAEDIRYLEYVKDAHLQALYARAEIFLFPSLYEGFGFPPLEAMMAGTPVISSAGGSLPEVLGEAAVIMEEFSIEAWRQAIQDLLAEPSRQTQLAARGHEQVKRYTWNAAARKTWDAYRSIAP